MKDLHLSPRTQAAIQPPPLSFISAEDLLYARDYWTGESARVNLLRRRRYLEEVTTNMSSRATIQHVVSLDAWKAHPGSPYAPGSLSQDGFVHCSPDTETTIAVVNAFYRDAPRPLLTLVLDVDRLTATCEWEPAVPVPPPGVTESTLFPHVFGPLNRDAVERVLEVDWDDQGQATGLKERD